MIGSIEQLEEMLSRPSEEDLSALKALDGDLLILGAGGKMGPTLTMRAARAGKRTIAVSRWSDAGAKKRLEAAGGAGAVGSDRGAARDERLRRGVLSRRAVVR